MYWPALRALSHGELTSQQLEWLRTTFHLDASARTEGPGATQSIAHRSFTDDAGAPLVLDLARTGESGWVFTLFHTGQQPSAATLESHRAAFRDAIDRLRLTLVEITPAATADEVLVPAPEPAGQPLSALGAHWDLPGELHRVWPHVGLREDAPREVKEVKLRELMSTPAWATAPEDLQRQAEAFLAGD
ncbi:hypothetical protein ACF1G0_32880 [Streptomyces sp. NPDC013953]|uniref:hypothetical protein n=1 Tax=Streptomyces sp. NPDC013953 TaxID=3364868 RepID=UPI0037011AD4